ncbi:ChbG/HpnK family deacetylase [Enterococcus casseliflavus]|uniref:ChbG/HpnK family deacetylase n=1 Tax=Enterococcus casseliflavus TaxID=37734 RepID=UPI001AD7C57E|nr:ChbG/HpnK family deacetylase [Enterococcus casseliflavus]
MNNNHRLDLIISADDFGLVPSVTDGILQGMSNGCITETNLIATSAYCVEAATTAKQHHLTHMGIHLNLEIGHSCFDGSALPNNKLPKGSWIYYNWVEKEFIAQCECLIRQGITLSHLTYHKDIITDVNMAQIVAKIAKLYKIPIRRVGNQKLNAYLTNLQINMPDIRIANTGGIDYSFTYLREKLHLVSKSTPKVVEVICHPGYTSEILSHISSLNVGRLQELKLFTDPKTICMIEEEGYTLQNYSILGDK